MALYLYGMLRRGDQEGARLLSDIIRPGNHCIPAPKQLVSDLDRRLPGFVIRYSAHLVRCNTVRWSAAVLQLLAEILPYRVTSNGVTLLKGGWRNNKASSRAASPSTGSFADYARQALASGTMARACEGASIEVPVADYGSRS